MKSFETVLSSFAIVANKNLRKKKLCLSIKSPGSGSSRRIIGVAQIDENNFSPQTMATVQSVANTMKRPIYLYLQVFKSLVATTVFKFNTRMLASI